MLTQVSNVASAVAQDETRYGKQYKLGDELLALLSGVRVYEADIKNNLNYDQLIWEFGTEENPDWIHLSYVSIDENRTNCLQAYKENGKTKYKYIT